VHDVAGKITGAKLKHGVGELPAGTLIDYEGVGTMSKSKNNGVDPQDLIDRYGADTARLYMMFTAPPEATLEWNDGAVEGSARFLKRVWGFGQKINAIISGAARGRQPSIFGPNAFENLTLSKEAQNLRRELYSVLKQIDYDYQRMQYNTVVSGAMKLLNALEDFKAPQSAGGAEVLAEGFGILLRCLYPATPHIAQGLWDGLGYDQAMGPLLDAPWPQVDEAALQQDEIEIMLQINGKLRGALSVPAGASKEHIEAAATATELVQKQLGIQGVKRVIVVPGRLVNVVMG
jgi:leucyl-tRNA synthetase